jgi:hypothetical protein
MRAAALVMRVLMWSGCRIQDERQAAAPRGRRGQLKQWEHRDKPSPSGEAAGRYGAQQFIQR